MMDWLQSAPAVQSSVTEVESTSIKASSDGAVQLTGLKTSSIYFRVPRLSRASSQMTSSQSPLGLLASLKLLKLPSGKYLPVNGGPETDELNSVANLRKSWRGYHHQTVPGPRRAVFALLPAAWCWDFPVGMRHVGFVHHRF